MPLHIIIHGRVQGVGFRWFVRELARDLDLAGWVRNTPDGSVEVAADGPPDAIAELRAALLRGPSGASVDKLEDRPPISVPLERPFTILR